MKLLPNISKTILHSFLFALGGAPTIAMIWVTLVGMTNQDQQFTVFVGLTIVIACVLIPLILIQNIFLMLKKQSTVIEDKIEGFGHFYIFLNIICLIFWIMKVFKVV